MVKHVILWKLNDMTDEEKSKIKQDIKSGLEGLSGKIDGLLSISVKTHGLSSSNADLMLDSAFKNADALAAYQTNPLHVAVADGVVRPNAQIRLCLDFEE